MRRAMVLAWGLLTLGGAGLAAAETVDREYDESFAVAPGDTLRLLHGDGDVEIRPVATDRMDVHVWYHVEVHGIGGPRDLEVDFERAGSVISVKGREVGAHFFVGGTIHEEYRYVIDAPAYMILDLHGYDGDVRVKDWSADIRIDSADGDVRIDGARGDLSIALADGDVDLYDLEAGVATIRLQDGDLNLRGGSGDWDLEVDDGDVDLDDLAAGSVTIVARDGDVELGLLSAGALDLDIRTADGDVAVELPRGAGGSFDLGFDDGSVHLDVDGAVVESKGKHRLEGVLGGGGAGEVRIRTRDGDITLRDGR